MPLSRLHCTRSWWQRLLSKQSFGDTRSQASAWERGAKQSDATTNRQAIRAGFAAMAMILCVASQQSSLPIGNPVPARRQVPLVPKLQLGNAHPRSSASPPPAAIGSPLRPKPIRSGTHTRDLQAGIHGFPDAVSCACHWMPPSRLHCTRSWWQRLLSKQSFGDTRSQASAWERGAKQSDATTNRQAIRAGFAAMAMILCVASQQSSLPIGNPVPARRQVIPQF